MNIYAVELDRLKAFCPGAELWDEGGAPLVFLPNMKVESSGAVHLVDLLLCPRARDSYETRLFFSAQLPSGRNWQPPNAIMARSWHTFSWQGIKAEQPWIDILASHLEAVK